MSMKKKKTWRNHVREELLRKCTDFYKSLYNQTVPTSESSDIEEIPLNTEDEVERDTLKRKKNTKPVE